MNLIEPKDKQTEIRQETILVLTTTGRDAEMTAGFLSEAGMSAEICANSAELCLKMLENAGLVFLTGESLSAETICDLLAALAKQPAWSDIPMIVLTSGGSANPVNQDALAALGKAGNVTLIERPVRMMTLMSAVNSALRARRRQYDIRDYLAAEQRTARQLTRLYDGERHARTEAESANRLKDDFLATVSHELRTPLNAMLGWTNLLRSGNLDADATRHALEVVERNAYAQAQIIEDLLDVSRIISGKITLDSRPFNLPELIESILESIAPAAATKKITVTKIIAANVNSITADAARLQQVLWNLLTNSIKFTPRGGSVEVRIERSDKTVSIAVTDTGKGIAPEFLPFVFERFRQQDGAITRTFGGLGLGLAIVRHLIELHGGTVQADSGGDGKGATFTVKLPVSDSNQTANDVEGYNENGAVKTPGNLNGLKILVVEDELDALEMIQIFLEHSGASVTAANSVNEALEKINSSIPDVIVSDIGMPELNGYQFIERLRSFPPENGGSIPAVALTAYAREEDVKRALDSGYQKHIAKPIDVNKLARIIIEIAGRG